RKRFGHADQAVLWQVWRRDSLFILHMLMFEWGSFEKKCELFVVRWRRSLRSTALDTDGKEGAARNVPFPNEDAKIAFLSIVSRRAHGLAMGRLARRCRDALASFVSRASEAPSARVSNACLALGVPICSST